MKTVFTVLICSTFAGVALGAPGFRAEVGYSHFAFRDSGLEGGTSALSVDEPRRGAPFVAAAYELASNFSGRLSYHRIDDARTTADFGLPSSLPPSPIPSTVTGHFVDDIDLISLAPEYNWAFAPRFNLAFGPQLHWVSSRGRVSYSTLNPLILLVAPRDRRESGFTLGGAVRLRCSLGIRAAVSVGYQFSDLDPSFDRKASVFSGGFEWSF